jgi:hypothetical protein
MPLKSVYISLTSNFRLIGGKELHLWQCLKDYLGLNNQWKLSRCVYNVNPSLKIR